MTERGVTFYRWDDMPKETVTPLLDRRLISGDAQQFGIRLVAIDSNLEAVQQQTLEFANHLLAKIFRCQQLDLHGVTKRLG